MIVTVDTSHTVKRLKQTGLTDCLGEALAATWITRAYKLAIKAGSIGPALILSDSSSTFWSSSRRADPGWNFSTGRESLDDGLTAIARSSKATLG
jgi:hypothetical protein